MLIHLLKRPVCHHLYQVPRQHRKLTQHILPNDGTVSIKRVRLSQPRSIIRRLVAATLIIVPTVVISGSVIITLASASHNSQVSRGDKDSVKPLFIPLGPIKAKPRTSYSKTDPEFIKFKSIRFHTKKRRAVKGTLVWKIRHDLEETQLGKILGKIKPEVGMAWLEMALPAFHPQEYEYDGLAFGKGYVAWATRKMSETEYNALKRVIWPDAVFKSLYASSEYILKFDMQRMRSLLTRLISSMKPSFVKSENDNGGATIGERGKDGGKGSVVKAENSSTVRGPMFLPFRNATSGAKSKNSESGSQSSAAPADSYTATRSDRPSDRFTTSSRIKDLNSNNHLLTKTLLYTLSKSWKQAPVTPPRGTMIVEGPIEVIGSRGRCVVNVVGVYDMNRGRYVHIQVEVRHLERIFPAKA